MIGEAVALRPRSSGATVDLGIALFREESGGIFRAAAVPLGVALVASALVYAWDPYAAVASAMGFGRFAQAPVTRVLAARASGTERPRGWRPALRDLAQGARVRIAAWSLLTLSALGGPLAIWVWVRQLFWPEVVLLEAPGHGEITRANQLAVVRGTTALAMSAWLMVIELWAAMAGELVGQGAWNDMLQLGQPFGSLGNGDVTPFVVVGIIAAQPVIAAVRFAAYLDARTRAEALDVFFALRAAGGGAQ